MERLLYFCNFSTGGIAKNSLEQCKALTSAGVEVDLLCPADWRGEPLDPPSRTRKELVPPPLHGCKPRWLSRLRYAKSILANVRVLENEVRRGEFRYVILGSYFEYLAPLWSRRLRRLARNGIVFGAMVLDPVRNYQVGPRWWHRWSVACGYSFLSEAFVHKEISLDTGRKMPGLRVSKVPHGPYFYDDPTRTRAEVRKDLGLPADGTVVLAFGHLRDNKNLDRLIAAISRLEGIHLLVVGSEAAPGHKQSGYYRGIAHEKGVEQRVCWCLGYVPDEKVNEYFTAADICAMPYSASFRSTSGILHIAAPRRIPLLVSCGDSPLGDAVVRYRLGIRIEPDSTEAIAVGLRNLMQEPVEGDWEGFERDFSYRENARILIERLSENRHLL